ncbi:MAG: hypothetical protein KKD44_12910 [Proteobacteria bacterium]|nr:hypothetical protein [Pseudomonadota bacterium]
MSRKILGLDIRRDSLSVVLIQGTLQGHVIEGLAHIDLRTGPSSQEQDTRTLDMEGDERGERLLAMIEKLAQTISFSDVDCFVSFPSIDMSFRNVSTPFKNKKKIRQILPFELEPVMPGSVDELTVDFIVLEKPTDEDETHLVSAAVNSNLLESFESCLKRGGLSVQAILPGGSATAEFLVKSCESYRNYLFLDMGLQSATLFLIHDNQIASIRSFLAEGLEENGLSISRTVLAFCEQNDMDYQPDMLYITGPGSRGHGVHEILGGATGMPVESVDVLKPMGFSIDERITDLWDESLYQNALALCYSGIYGIKGLRLSERFVALTKYFSDYKNQIIQSGIFLAMVLVVLLGSVVFESYSVNRTIRNYDREMVAIFKEAFPAATKIIDPYNQMKANVAEERKKSAFGDSNAGNIRIIDLVNDISKTLPDSLDIEFDRFVLGNDDLKISGSTDTYATVDDMKTRLEKIDYFKGVVITSTSGGQSDKQVHFKLKIDF